MSSSGGVAPGVFFVGGLRAPYKKLLRPILTGLARPDSGYTKFVEPACGAFGYTHVALQSGWKPSQIEASDVTLFSSVLGAIVSEDGRADHLNVKVDGYEDEDLGDPAVLLYVQGVVRAEAKAKNPYWKGILKEMLLNREDHIERLRERIKRIGSRLSGVNYRPMDLFDHLAEVVDDPKAVVGLMPPWAKGDFENLLDPTDSFTWDAPEYPVFNPKEGFERLYEIFQSAKCLVLMGTRTEYWDQRFPAFGMIGGKRLKEDRGITRTGAAVFLSNRHEEVMPFLEGNRMAYPWPGHKMKPPPWPFLPKDYAITDNARVTVAPVDAEVATYCHFLWTHKFVGSGALYHLGVFLDGYLVGILGLSLVSQGGVQGSNLILQTYGMTVQHRRDFRLPRLLTYLSMCKAITGCASPTTTRRSPPTWSRSIWAVGRTAS